MTYAKTMMKTAAIAETDDKQRPPECRLKSPPSLLCQRGNGFVWAGYILLLGAWLLFPSLTWSQDAGAVETVVAHLATELAQRFPRVTGEVLKVEGNRMYVSLGKQHNVVRGMRLTLFRQGSALPSSAAGKVTTRLEEELGTLDVLQVFERYAVTTLVGPSQQVSVQRGDNVRITAGRIAVGLMPVATRLTPTLRHHTLDAKLQDALEATGRFRVIPPDRVRIWLLEHGLPPDAIVPPERMPALASALQVAYIVLARVKTLRGTDILDLQLQSPTQHISVATASGLLPQTTLAQPSPPPTTPVPKANLPQTVRVQPALLAPQTPTAPSTATLTPSIPTPAPQPTQKQAALFKTPPRPPAPNKLEWNLTESLTEIHRVSELSIGMDAGDVDGDGHVEVVVMTDSAILLYRLQGQRLTPIDTFTPKKEGRLLSVQLLRLGSSKMLGIVVNRQATVDIDSFILTLQGQRLVIWKEHLLEILLAIDDDGDGIKESLWGQPFDEELFFYKGTVWRYRPVNGTLKRDGKKTVPYAFRATGATLAKLSAKGPRDLVFVDENHKLRIYRNEKKLWSSRAQVGGSSAFGVKQYQSGVDVIKDLVFFEAPPVVTDVDRDGIDEVLIVRNAANLLGLIPNRTKYSDGDVVLLRQETHGYTLSPISPPFNGMVSGLAVFGGDTPGILIAVTQRQDILGRKGETVFFMSQFQ